jgi:AcrR family transcriptional regulator
MPKGSPELTARRKNEIVDACESIYREKGFHGLTIKEIGERTDFTRPLIYHYFKTKEEILLALLIREYEKWIVDLKKILPEAGTLAKEELARRIAHTFQKRDLLLKIENMNLYDLENGSRTEHLARFKTVFFQAHDTMRNILKAYAPAVSEEQCAKIIPAFFAFLYGVYPFACHTPKQLEAIRAVGRETISIPVEKMLEFELLSILPDQK